jgi:hypothetical protein
MSPSMTDSPDDLHFESREALEEAVLADVKRKTCLKFGFAARMLEVM